MEVVIVGGGIGGLTLALTLDKAGIPSRVFESSPEIKPIGVGINLLPHATKELARLGLDKDLARVAVETREAVFFNRFGQLIYRKQLHPGEGEPLYSGVNMWRGVTRWPAFLSGASMVRAGWLKCGKMVIYPIRERIDAEGRQLVNWVAEIETPRHQQRDWNRRGSLDDFLGAFEEWHFDWLDVPAFIRAADAVLEFPMVDQDPLPFWTQGRVTLLGAAAHPMVPRGSNGAGQAILDARALADALVTHRDPAEALQAYEAKRREATANVVRMNRQNPPDAILREVFVRSGDRPFERIEDVIPIEELKAISERYKRVAGYDRESLSGPAAAGGK